MPPIPRCSAAVEAVRAALPGLGTIEEVFFCCFSAADLAVYRRLVKRQPAGKA
ncbi:MAG: hypothetical protein NTW45_01620 [Rhodocyclales bacterium]|nr:hypothetical protein [Rhodocyclales bacterium]